MPPLHVTHLSFAAHGGGAAIAARRTHMACALAGLHSDMLVRSEVSDADEQADEIHHLPARRGLRRLVQREYARHLRRRAGGEGLRSLGLVDSGAVEALSQRGPDVVNLHWVANDTLSLREISHIKQPLVWTLHDMWAFGGTRHIDESRDWVDGFASRPAGDLDRRIWQRKRHLWSTPIQIVTPSTWLADCVRQSALMRDWPVEVIPNPLDTATWHPVSRRAARARLGIAPEARVVAFGAMGGASDPNKGFAHLRDALNLLHDQGAQISLVMFGGGDIPPDLPFPITAAGYHSDPAALRDIYAAADLFALPSRVEVLGQVGMEALACGVPVVGFRIGGLPDLVSSPDTGALATPFDPGDLARAIDSVLTRQTAERSDTDLSPMGRAARAHAVARFDQARVGEAYAALYDRLVRGD